MNRYENSRQKKIHELVGIVKLISLLFCGSMIFSKYLFNQGNQVIKYKDIFNGFSIGILIFIIVLIYQAWIISLKKTEFNNKPTIADYVETLVYIVVFTGVIFYSGGYESEYKFLYLFIIITTTMQFGMKHGIVVSCISTAIVLSIDLLSEPFAEINMRFQNDLIMAGIFLITAWLLGYYVNAEKEHRETLLMLANKDELTGVFNHRYFHEALKKVIDDTDEAGIGVSLLFIDIDYFKYYNDLYGHQSGDSVLKIIGTLLKNNVRERDIVSRYGGEEFAIILPDTEEEIAIELGEKIRKAIENNKFYGEEYLPNGKITISVGVSSYPKRANSIQSLINSADDALYRAKFFNKNRVEVYYSILEELKNDIDKEYIDLITSIKTLISVINAKDRYTYGHTERVVLYCDRISKYLNLSEQDRKMLRYGAYLHDIGKIDISKDILNKKMPLTDEEWEILKQHPVNGVEIIKPVKSLEAVRDLILYHHERFDGNGYPSKLKGQEIPYLARILCVADSFDAMTSNRPYKVRMSHDEAIIELERCKGTQFDPAVVDAFISMMKNSVG